MSLFRSLGQAARSNGLLTSGALPRIAVALAIVALLWLGFFWAIASPGVL